MKLSLTHYGKTISAEVERDDLNINEVAHFLFMDVMAGAGYDPSSVRLGLLSGLRDPNEPTTRNANLHRDDCL